MFTHFYVQYAHHHAPSGLEKLADYIRMSVMVTVSCLITPTNDMTLKSLI